MRVAGRLIPAASARGLAPALLRRSPCVELDWDERQKSRLEALDSAGQPLAIVLPRGTVMRGGDVLLDAAGQLTVVRSRPQPVMLVRPCRVHGTAHDLVRAAYHLGNRHVPVDVRSDHLRLEPDHVLAQMLRGMDFEVETSLGTFEPEAGAYARHAHGAAHPHAHDHNHDVDQGHAAGPAHRHGPVVHSGTPLLHDEP